MTRIVLFDIDGTLMLSGGAGARALGTAFRELHQVPEVMAEVTYAGRTDPAIVRDIFRVKLGRHGADGEVESILERYVTHLRGEIETSPKALVLPGVEPLLQSLSGRDDVVLGLLTGNIERGARLKLGRFGLDRYFEFGGYASDSEDRDEIARVALGRARERCGAGVTAADTVVVGDTPRDISCARAIGARVLAVATGPHSCAELAGHTPDWLFDDLSDTAGVLRVLLNGTHVQGR
ncbi:MAG: HAD family hydrolase [Candidatus Wallbacteria bacterium]|nr:HAD family hydrolase [Candidatus Wallbacteria bacterium]